MTACHFIADRDLTFLCNVYAHDFVYSGRELVSVFTRESLDIDNDSRFSVRQSERVVAHFTGLVSEYCAEQSFFGGKFGLSLRRNLTYEYIAGSDLGTLADNTFRGKVLKGVFADILNFTGNLFRTELGIARFLRVLFDMNRGVHIFADKPFVKQNRVLVVVTFPSHESDKSVFAERDLAV